MLFIWCCFSIIGGVYSGHVSSSTTTLTANLSSTEASTIHVTSTDGFPDTGYIVIEGERIGYPAKTSTTFTSDFLNDITRGNDDFPAASHSAGAAVRTVENSLLNDSLQYQVATFADSSGVLGFVSIPLKFLKLLGTFFILPTGFLGTDLQIITFIWAAIAIGTIVAISISVTGGRRV